MIVSAGKRDGTFTPRTPLMCTQEVYVCACAPGHDRPAYILQRVIYLPLACTHPDNGVEFGHGHLFGSVNCSSDLLLMFLGEKRQDLSNYGV